MTPTTATQASTLRDLALSALSLLVTNTGEPEFQFLLNTPPLEHPAAALRACLDNPTPADLPLALLARRLSLSPVDVMAVQLALAVEEDALVGRALARLQAPIGGSRPTAALLAAALAPFSAETAAPSVDALVSSPAFAASVLTLTGDHAPLPEQLVTLSPLLRDPLRGRDGAWPGACIGLGPTPEVPIPPSFHDEIDRIVRGFAVQTHPVLAIRTGSPAEGRSVACALAARLGARAAFLSSTDKLNGVAAWLHLRRLIPTFSLDLAPGERRMLPPIPFHSGPVLAVTGPDGALESPSGAVLNWRLPVPTRDERTGLWLEALDLPDLAAELAEAHRHGCGRISHLGRLASWQAAMRGTDLPDESDVRAASWTTEGAGLEALAQPLPDPIPAEALVIPDPVWKQMHMLVLRCRMRDSLVDGLGASATARYRPGVRALFVGPSGTGKTLAAGWLSTTLGLPLYRVDLAAVTSKYIGETEKNLSQLLARAEQSELILLFDEADSLFGKRTEVKEANDRFANAQTNYLLQRLESFDGITILTSNSRSRFDSAFFRRLDLIVDFPAPNPHERRLLWRSHLGEHHSLSEAQLNLLAVAGAELTGGHIRNAVLSAAVLAHRDSRAISFSDVVEGLSIELRKLGKPVPADLQSARNA